MTTKKEIITAMKDQQKAMLAVLEAEQSEQTARTVRVAAREQLRLATQAVNYLKEDLSV